MHAAMVGIHHPPFIFSTELCRRSRDKRPARETCNFRSVIRLMDVIPWGDKRHFSSIHL